MDESAPAVVRLTAIVRAPLDRLWDLHTDIAAWPAWNPGISRAEPAGPLAVGTVFHWHTHGLDITSTVLEAVPGRRLVWGGPAHGIDGIHAWTFEDAGDGTVAVRTEESWSGPPVDADPDAARHALRESLGLWLAALKAAAERP
ncbi:Shy6-polyketide cyclase [Streptomyces globosus]|uniref:Shy6-polyketide cyclase n=1 Tax=Streptomyces globosus TaxID=68209 RepID=A0A344U9E7_9ACTN|nr:Shy6-polyketide cyclase [Streptomyces globosus]